ncbi:MAG TPA: serine hydrolase domain-containing protein [Thermoanaerobaculia bacterium]|nr:serine hydrolase domain-containing protein [Thermoanaerobaculia bacterium]
MHSLLPVLLALATASASPQVSAADAKAKVDAIFRDVDRSDSPGCAVGVYRDGQIAYARGYGMANLELHVGNTSQTVFDIGSVSKQFTAIAIHLLAREGKLSLDDDIRKWVPEIPSYGKTVTLRHLLHHTGGLRDYIELMSLQGMVEEDLSPESDVLEIMARQKAPNFAPGEDYLYCNTGYNLLALVVEKASGQSLRDFSEQRIFAPLGMRHTQISDSHTRIIPNRATGYQKEGSGYGIEMSDWEQTGDGAVLTTVEDLFRWNQNFFEPKVGDAKLIADMQVVGVLNSGKKIDYASALRLGPYRGLPTVSHSGSWAGYRAQLLRFPEQKFAVACLCNDGGASNPSQLSRKVAEVYLGGLMRAEPAGTAPKKGAAPAPKYAASGAELQKLAGAYLSRDTGRIVHVTVAGKGLSADAGTQKLTLVPASSGRFRIEESDGAEVQFDAVAGGRPVMRVTTGDLDDREIEVFDPVGVASPGPAELAELAGDYTSEELATTWRLVVENGKLYVRHRGLSKDPLVPTVKDAMNLDGMNLRFRRDGAGKVTGFTLDEGRVRGIGFKKT